MNITTLGIDIAKEVFQLCGADATGKVILKKRLTRGKFLEYMSKVAKCRVVMEACGSSNYWGRKFIELGHRVDLISPQFVKPFVKGNKNDARDAEAILEAGSRPEMRYVSIKTVERQDFQSLLRIREGYLKMRTLLVNQVRGLLAEYGQTIPQGVDKFRKKLAILSDRVVENGLTPMMKTLLETQYCTLLTLDEKIGVCDIQLSAIAEQQPTCKQLMTIPGVGVISAVALYATIGKGDGFKNGRHLSAFLGLVPRQHSSGNKERLLGISKRGDEFVRRMLVHGARSVVLWASKKEDKKSQWINSLKARRGLNKTCVAVANKNARTVMSMLQSGEIYRKAA